MQLRLPQDKLERLTSIMSEIAGVKLITKKTVTEFSRNTTACLYGYLPRLRICLVATCSIIYRISTLPPLSIEFSSLIRHNVVENVRVWLE